MKYLNNLKVRMAIDSIVLFGAADIISTYLGTKPALLFLGASAALVTVAYKNRFDGLAD